MMKIFFAILLYVSVLQSYGQSEGDDLLNSAIQPTCDSLVKYPDEEPILSNFESHSALVKELLLPIYEKHLKRVCFLAKHYFTFTIDEKGKIIEVEIKNNHLLSDQLKIELVAKLKEKTKWKPAVSKGIVCCSLKTIAVKIDII